MMRHFILTLAAASAFAAEPDFLSNPRQLVFDGARSGEGYFHPDGKRLVFQSEREAGNPFYQIYTLDLESGDSSRVSTGAGKTTCAFFQPGTSRLLYGSTHHDPQAAEKQRAELEFRASGKQRRYAWDYDAEMEIYTANADGSGQSRLTNSPGYDAEAAFSPDGKQIVFCSLRGAYGRELTAEEKARLEKDPAWFGDIYIMDADGGNVRQLTRADGYDGGPFFSPDGTRIVWRRFDASGMNADVFTMRTDGSDARRVTDFKAMSWAPYFHPSGRYVIFTSNKHGFENFELFIVDAEGQRQPVRVTTTDGFDGLPVFSPDGKKLCWTSNRTGDGKSQLFLADWNHEAALAALGQAPERVAEKLTAPPAPTGSAEITAADLKNAVAWLADPARAGRGTGTPGAAASADWIAEQLRAAGLKPLPGDTDFFSEFEFNAGERLLPEKNVLSVNGTEFKADVDFRPLAFTENGEAEGEVVFAGYGLNVPGDRATRYDSFDGLDVNGKIVLLLRFVPEQVEPARRAQLNRYAGLRYKAMMARERGAKAVLVVSGPNSAEAGKLQPLSNDGSHSGSGIIAHSISAAVADALLAPSGKKLKDVQDALDLENPHAEGAFALPGVRVKISAGVEHLKKQDRNVAAMLPPVGTDEYVILGAHYDHLGNRATGSSLARSGEENQVHPGADDNASGVAALLEIAASISSEKTPAFRRGVVFGFWSGEEMGLLGSNAFTDKPPLDLTKCAAYLNFDMVGRLRDNKLTLQGLGSSMAWRRLIEKRNVAAGFALTLQDDPYLPTDTTSFYPKRVPVLAFFTGAHDDYHRPTDTAEKLDYTGLERIARFASALTRDVSTSPERIPYSRVERSQQQTGSRDTMRAYLGSIPDYATEIKGVKLSGVRAGSPAEKAGLQGGDIIVEFGGQKIANIYDYTYALDAVKIGVPVNITVERAGEKRQLTVTPEARK